MDELIGVCPACGAYFLHETKRGRRWVYCPQHRGVGAAKLRRAETGLRVGRPPGHNCTERCEIVRGRIQQEHPPTLQAIGDELGVSREAVRLIVNKHGWTKERHTVRMECRYCGGEYWGVAAREAHNATPEHRAITEATQRRRIDKMRPWDTINFVVALHQAGYKPPEIAHLVDNHIPSIYRWLSEFGFNPYTRGPQTRINPDQAKGRDAHIAHLYALGVSTKGIMEMFAISRGNLARIAKEQRVKRPDWFLQDHMERMRAASVANRRQARESKT